MNRAHVNGQVYEVASSWNELRPAQLLALVHVLFSTRTLPHVHGLVLRVLLRMSLVTQLRLGWQIRRAPMQIKAELLPLTGFVLYEQARLSKQLLPRIRPRWFARPWYGPGDRLAGLSFTEWIEAEAALFGYRQRQDELELNRLVAILYRPGRQAPNSTTGDRRPAYVQHELEARALVAARLPLHVRQAILLYYDGCRQVYIDAYPDVFGRGEEKQSHQAAKNPAPAYLRILRELAGSADRFEVIGRQPVSNIFFDLSERMKQLRELEADLKRNK